MYSYEDRVRAVELYIKYGMSAADTVRELGYPSRKMLRRWHKEHMETGGLHQHFRSKSRYSEEQKKHAIERYHDLGRSIPRTIRALGYPSRETLRQWIDELIPGERAVRVRGGGKRHKDYETRKQAVIDLCSREGSAAKVAAAHGVSRTSLYLWKHQLLPQEDSTSMKKKKKGKPPLSNDVEELRQEVDSLQKRVHYLQMEQDILLKANELLKKDQGISLQNLKNREKTLLIDALRSRYGLVRLLNYLKLPKSSYCYHHKRLGLPEKYSELRKKVVIVFNENEKRYGYRRIHAVVGRYEAKVSEKVIRRLMAEEQLIVLRKKRGKYNSYRGELSPPVENIIARDFSAAAPNHKWLTDITEFGIPAGKVYLSPMLDCFDGLVVSWTIGPSPTAELVTTMLDTAISTLRDGEHPIVHSDRGAHYRWPQWVSRMNKAGLTRSMSKKGCTPDNAACEGFFGRLKNEMFYYRDWSVTTIEEFIDELDRYIRWYNDKRIKMSLGALSPVEYRKSLDLVA
jgi:putative transposase